MAGTVLKLGWTNPLTDTFGNHPILGAVLDLNDGVNYTLITPDGLEMPPPPKTIVTAGNIRTQGERATRALYRHNREVVLRLIVGPGSSYSSFVSNLRTLMQWLQAPPQTPIAMQYQAPSATSPVYLDIVGCAHDLPSDEGSWLRLQFEPLEMTILARPGLRGDRVTLQNLAVNPGFSAPSGPGVTVFADTFASVGAYSVVAGAAPTLSPANTYVDSVSADTPLRYYRLDESAGTSAYDIAGTNAIGTTHGSPTQSVAGLISGDTDTCYTFASASSQYVSVPTTGLPIGNSPLSLEAWIKFAANPAASAGIIGYGSAGTAHQAFDLYVSTTGHAVLEIGGGSTTVTSIGALSTGVVHHVVGTWDGTTMTLYVDGVSQGTATPGNQAIPSNPFVGIGALAGPSLYFSGQIDEACVYSIALSGTRVTAHYNAGHTGATGTVSNAMSVAAASQISFGSPNWSAVNTWQLRFRWLSAMTTMTCYLHFTNANNYLSVALTQTLLRLNESIAGVVTHLATSSALNLVHEGWFWLQVTQFPTVSGNPAYLTATLLADSSGVVGSQIATISAATLDSVTALSGQLQMAPTGAALAIGGATTATQGNSVSLFGPGGWQFLGTGSLVSNAVPASGAWEQTLANTFPNGPIASVGAARIDVPPVGTYDAQWHLTVGGAGVGTPPNSFAIPCAQNQVMNISAWVKSAGLGANANTILRVAEYDASGNLVGSAATIATKAGNIASWFQLQATYTILGATTAYLDVMLRSYDATANESANGTVWFDNVQVFNQTTTGQTSMPYCELLMSQAPAQLLVSGLLGDLPAPTLCSFGTYLANWPVASLLNYALGRGAQASATARLVGNSTGYNVAASGIASLLDASSYGGYVVQTLLNSGGWNPRAFSPLASDAPGVYHLLARLQTAETGGNLSNVSTRISTQQRTQAWYGQSNGSDQLGNVYGPFVAPFTVGNQFQIIDAGQAQLPPYAAGALTDPTQTYLTPRPQLVDSTGGGANAEANWQLLLPIDGSLILGVINNPANGLFGITGQWLWAYLDGLLVNRAGANDSAAWATSIENTATPNAGHSGGGPGTQQTGSININSGADPYLTLDPTQQLPNGAGTGIAGASGGVNMLAGYVADGSATVLPLAGEIRYSPLYLYPR